MYTLYEWRSDDEGGTGICYTNDFNPWNQGYYPESGWRAEPSIKVGEFDTAEELVKLYKKLYDDEMTLEDAVRWIAEFEMLEIDRMETM